jgi:hypothetical protein
MVWLRAEIVSVMVEDPYKGSGGYRRVGKHRISSVPGRSRGRKATLQSYELPKIILPSEHFGELIGRKFKVFKTKIRIEGEGTGNVVILFFPENEENLF